MHATLPRAETRSRDPHNPSPMILPMQTQKRTHIFFLTSHLFRAIIAIFSSKKWYFDNRIDRKERDFFFFFFFLTGIIVAKEGKDLMLWDETFKGAISLAYRRSAVSLVCLSVSSSPSRSFLFFSNPLSPSTVSCHLILQLNPPSRILALLLEVIYFPSSFVCQLRSFFPSYSPLPLLRLSLGCARYTRYALTIPAAKLTYIYHANSK